MHDARSVANHLMDLADQQSRVFTPFGPCNSN